jgi:hypothetical protein
LKEKGSEEAIMHSRKSDEDEMSVESFQLSVCMSMIQKIDAIIGWLLFRCNLMMSTMKNCLIPGQQKEGLFIKFRFRDAISARHAISLLTHQVLTSSRRYADFSPTPSTALQNDGF